MKSLPTTSYLVLGLLSWDRPMSGYEIRKWAEQMRFFYWSPAQSQIYGELNRLAERGWVTASEVAQDGRPDKRVFSITPAGQAELSRWLAEDPAGPTIVKNGTALKLYFGHATTPETLLRLLHEHLAELDEMLGQTAIVQEFLEADEGTIYPSLVVEWVYLQLEAERSAARQMLARLQAGLQST